MRKNSTIAELLDRSSCERKYLNAEERQAFFDATTYMDVGREVLLPMLYYTGYFEKVVWIQTLKQKPGKPLPRVNS